MNRIANSMTTISPRDVLVIQDQLVEWGLSNFRQLPWRKRLPLWKGLIVEVLLQRTRAIQVVEAFEILDTRYRVAADLGGATELDVDELIQPLGLHWRKPLFYSLIRQIADRNGRLPRELEGLLRLPGIGPYAASAALSLYGNVRAAIVDANTVRIAARLVGRSYDGETRRKRWCRELLGSITPAINFRQFNYALLDLGALVCTPFDPSCSECPLNEICAVGRSAAESTSF